MDELKANMFLTIMAYANGAWAPEQVIQAFEYIQKEATKAVPDGKVKLSKAVDNSSGQETH